MQYTSDTEEAYLTALRLSYLGRVRVALFLFLFVAELCGKKLPIMLKLILTAIQAGIYVTVLTLPDCRLYYEEYEFYMQDGFAHFSHTNGITHHIFTVIQLCCIITGFVMLFMSFKKEKTRIARKRLRIVIYAITAMTFFYVVQISGLFGVITHVFDITIIGYTICTTFMYIAMLRCDLLGTGELAREYMIDKLSEGIIAVDGDGTVQYFNDPAKMLYPELRISQSTVPAAITDAIESGENININDRIYSPEVNDLTRGNERMARIYALIDDTEHYRYMQELEAMTERANAANEAKSSFLANMSHDIRTPINALLGMNEMILRESEEQDTLTCAENVRTAGRTLLSLINDLVTVRG